MAGPSRKNSRASLRGVPEETPNIKVCVRVRPFIQEEYNREGNWPEICVLMPSSRKVELSKTGEETRQFEFDRAYWSFCEDDQNFSGQNVLYEELGETLLNHAISGFNNCIFAYGQTASGKSFSVLGGKEGESRGLLPRVVQGLFEHLNDLPTGTTFKCLVSFIEIYNDQIRDLLNESHCRGGSGRTEQKLEIRQHPVIGTFIPGLTEAATGSCYEVLDLIDYGTTIRSVGETAMNQNSSRSHCIFTFKTTVSKDGHSRLSQTHLVDLAGSERTKRTGATGDRLREGAAINKSLSTLARVISALAGDDGRPPFRESKLTYILKESLCGNSKTVMIGAISPSLCDYDETLSTLRFAQSVKKVQTRAVVNEANEGDIEHQLRSEVQRLKEQLEQYQKEKSHGALELENARRQLEEQEDLYHRYTGDWDTALATERRHQVQRRAVTHADLAHLQEQFLEMHRDNVFRRQLSKEGVESSGSSEDWDPLGSSESESDSDNGPVLLHMSKTGGDPSAVFPRRLSREQKQRLGQGALVATADVAEELARAVKQLKTEAAEAESLIKSMSAPGATLIQLLPMVAVDPSESDAAKSKLVITVLPTCGFSDLFDEDDAKTEAEPVEWLSEAELHSRLLWLRLQKNGASSSSLLRQRFAEEGPWAACKRATQAASVSSHDMNEQLAQLRAELSDVQQRQKQELEEVRAELAEAKRHAQERDAELLATKRELEFSDRARQELVLADAARRELEQEDYLRRQTPLTTRQELVLADAARRELEQEDYSRRQTPLTFVPLVRAEAREGDVAAEIAASFRNALGALDQAQAALKGKRNS